MKKNKAIYYTSTFVFCFLIFIGGINSFGQEMTEAFNHLGFPGYFRIELAVAKFIGVALLLFPFVPKRLKEWAYAALPLLWYLPQLLTCALEILLVRQ